MIEIHKSDLDPSHGGALYNYDRYRSVAIPVDLAGLKNVGIGGSSSQANATRRFDLRVRWMGAEKVALRSITVRDGVRQ